MERSYRTITMVALLVAWSATAAFAAGAVFHKPGTRDKCPVCGMFVVKYPDFAAQIQFKDGTIAHFDGAKDMFRFYQDLPRYAPEKKQTDVHAVFVTSYYSLTPIDGLQAYYVIGSDILGPMGQELIAFKKKEEAREFLKDHRGKSVIRFPGLTAAILRTLE